MRTVLRAMLGMSVALLGGHVLAAPAPLMTVLMKPGLVDQAAGRGDLDVILSMPEVDAPAGASLISMGTRVPGMAEPLKVTDIVVSDALGAVPVTDRGKDGGLQLSPDRAVKGDLTLRYRLHIVNVPILSGGPPTQPRIDGDGFSGAGGGLIASVKTNKPYRIALKWDLAAMGPGASAVSSYGDGDVKLPVGPISRLDPIVMMAGHLKHSPDVPKGAFEAVWVGSPPFDPRPSMEWTAKLHAYMSRFFRDKTEPPYRVFLRYNPMNAGGGAALTHSFLATYGAGVTGENLKPILGHEMTHTWTADPRMDKWYNEGDAVYYQALLGWRANLFPTDKFLEDLNLTASRYYTDKMRDAPNSEIASRFWGDTRIRVLPYDRGAMYFAVLNGKIRKASGGKRSIDDLVLDMVARMQAGRPTSEAVWVDMLRKELGDEGPAIHRSMMAGGLMLPESDGFGPCFHRVTRKIRQFELGYDPASLIGPDRRIKGLMAGSEAEKAGLRDGDAVTYGVALDAVQADVNRTFTLQVTRDGKTFPITYLPRGDAVDAYQWERTTSVPDSACRY
jgi:hypothetical protein